MFESDAERTLILARNELRMKAVATRNEAQIAYETVVVPAKNILYLAEENHKTLLSKAEGLEKAIRDHEEAYQKLFCKPMWK